MSIAKTGSNVIAAQRSPGGAEDEGINGWGIFVHAGVGVGGEWGCEDLLL